MFPLKKMDGAICYRQSPQCITRPARSRGFTIAEVMVAATVMVLAISSSIIVLQQGLRAIDTARYTTLAGQILQSQMEKLRLLTWTQRGHHLWPSATAYATFTPDITASNAQKRSCWSDIGKCAQSIVAAPPPYASTMKKITLINWTGLDGRRHRSLIFPIMVKRDFRFSIPPTNQRAFTLVGIHFKPF
jgi:type II secretory pathway pseudopilin PulG